MMRAKQILEKDKTPGKSTELEAPYVSDLEFPSESIFEVRKTHKKESRTQNTTLIDNTKSTVTG